MIALPIPEKNYVSLKIGKEGVVFYSEYKSELNKTSLNRYTLEKKKMESITADASFFEVSADKSKLVYVTSNSQIIISDAGGKPNLSEETVNMSSIQVKIDPIAQ
jgi:tricorn protease-like protein